MTYFKGSKKDDGVADTTESAAAPRPVTPGGSPLGVQRSGARVRVDPPDGSLCTSFEDAYEENWGYLWIKVQRPGLGDAAQDVFQAVALRLYVRISAGEMRHPLKPALLGMIDDELRDHYRGVRRQRIEGEPDEEGMPASKPNPERQYLAAADAVDEKEVMEATFRRLKPQEQQILNLVDFEELPVKEAASKAGITEENVYVRLHRARKRFVEVGRRLRDLLHRKRRAS